MSETETVTPPPTEGARKGFIARVIGVVFAPGETFTDIGRKPTIIAPLLLLMLIQGIVTFVVAPAQGADQATFMENSEFIQRTVAANLSEEQWAEQMEQTRNPPTATKVMGAVFAPIAIVIIMMIFALIYWGIGNLLGGEPTFKKVYSMMLFAGILMVGLNSLVKMPLMVAKNTVAGVTFSPAMFMPNLEVTSSTYRLLSNFDVFAIWGTVLVGIGLARVSKISTAKGMVTSFIFWALVGTLGYAIANFFS